MKHAMLDHVIAADIREFDHGGEPVPRPVDLESFAVALLHNIVYN